MTIYRFIFLTIFFAPASYLMAQSSKVGIGSGVNLQFGLNPKTEHLEWIGENVQTVLMPQKRFLFGPVFQWKNYSKIQAEVGMMYGRLLFKSYASASNGIQDIIADDWQIPSYLVINTKSPIRHHSAIVYKVGFLNRLTNFRRNESILRQYKFYTPVLSTGIYLSTEVHWYGRFEYGFSYSKNLREKHVMYIDNNDSPSTKVTYTDMVGQFKAGITYFFTPHVYHWSKKRYKLTDIEY